MYNAWGDEIDFILVEDAFRCNNTIAMVSYNLIFENKCANKLAELSGLERRKLMRE